MITFNKLTLALAVTAAIPALAASTSAMAASTCTLATLNGTYTYAYSGVNIVNKVSVPFSAAGYGIYDGKGGLTGKEVDTTTNAKGAIVVSTSPYTGTYKLSGPCTYTEVDNTAGSLSHYTEYSGPAGNTINFVETDQGSVNSATETRD